MKYKILKKVMFVVVCVCVICMNYSVAIADEDVIGAEVTVEPEEQFTSYRTPEDDVILYDAEVVSEEVEVEEDVDFGTSTDDEILEIASEDDMQDDQDDIEELDVVPQTGDSSNLLVWGCILVVTLVATIVLGINLFKKR
ncbi:MAG: hypothetical protein E7262_10925 [Lachnospiraceae bacterium]|nr:hypothetical protein [Lachnospiraceae bacterium]